MAWLSPLGHLVPLMEDANYLVVMDKSSCSHLALMCELKLIYILELEFKVLIFLLSVLSTLPWDLFSPWMIVYVRFHGDSQYSERTDLCHMESVGCFEDRLDLKVENFRSGTNIL